MAKTAGRIVLRSEKRRGKAKRGTKSHLPTLLNSDLAHSRRPVQIAQVFVSLQTEQSS